MALYRVGCAFLGKIKKFQYSASNLVSCNFFHLFIFFVHLFIFFEKIISKIFFKLIIALYYNKRKRGSKKPQGPIITVPFKLKWIIAYLNAHAWCKMYNTECILYELNMQ